MRAQNILTQNKKMYIKECLAEGATNYSHFLTGKVFLIICDDCTERTIRFFKKDYIHLTGIKSNVSDDDFFTLCKKRKLADGNIFTRQYYNWSTLKGKAVRIKDIHKIVYADVKESLFIFDLHTNTADFPVAIRNSTRNTCVGFIDNIHKARTLRKYSNSGNSECEKKIAAIFARPTSQTKYNELVYISNVYDIYTSDNALIHKLSNSLRNRLTHILKNKVEGEVNPVGKKK